MSNVKSVLVNDSDASGGAAIAAYRIHKAIRHVGGDSTMLVNKKSTDDWTVCSSQSVVHKSLMTLRNLAGRAMPEWLFSDANKTYRSYNWLPSRKAATLNKREADIAHLVWVNRETLSIKEIAKIKKPVIMTLEDMWAFCGAEHYSEEDRYKSGYEKSSKPSAVRGIDVDRWVWMRKQAAWKQPFQLVAISEWLADCIRDSALMSDWPVEVIPNPLDTSVWKPLDRAVARRAFNLPEDKKIILFGALGGTSIARKGYTYFEEAIARVAQMRNDCHLVVYGQSPPQQPRESPFPISYTGRLSDPVTMCLLNNAADVFVSPAIQEAFGQTASEAQACGTPVVAFAKTGIADIVEHKATGYLAKHADAKDLADGVMWVLDHDNESESGSGVDALRDKCRSRAVSRFSYDVVGKRYQALYASVLAQQNQ